MIDDAIVWIDELRCAMLTEPWRPETDEIRAVDGPTPPMFSRPQLPQPARRLIDDTA